MLCCVVLSRGVPACVERCRCCVALCWIGLRLWLWLCCDALGPIGFVLCLVVLCCVMLCCRIACYVALGGVAFCCRVLCCMCVVC